MRNNDNEKVAMNTFNKGIFSKIETQAGGSSRTGCSDHWPWVTYSCSDTTNLLMIFPI